MQRMPEAARLEFAGMPDEEASALVVTGVLQVCQMRALQGHPVSIARAAELVSESLQDLGFRRVVED